MTPARLFLLTSATLIAFAANSVLGRLGLVGGDIGPGSFALIRLLSGALLLAILLGPKTARRSGGWAGAMALFIYAAFFSYAYITMDAGAGALLLFSVVQIVMVGTGLLRGERLRLWQWAGLLMALCAMFWWLLPDAQSPPIAGSAAMILAGIGWAAYSLLGLKGSDPAASTAGNFLRASLLACLFIPLAFIAFPEQVPSLYGISLAVLSGAITSGLGYVLWYKALPHLSASRAGISQLSVPVIAAFGGVLFLGEAISQKFIIVSILILGGVALATLTRKPAK